MTISEAGKILRSALNTIYDQREAPNISNLLLEKLTGFSRSKRVIYKDKAEGMFLLRWVSDIRL